MFTANPKDTERYSLRLLLLNVKGTAKSICKIITIIGATSFEYLRSYNGTVYDTFEECAKEMDLISDPDNFDRAMIDACLTASPQQLRSLFASLINFCGYITLKKFGKSIK